jgi:hypothetical protein
VSCISGTRSVPINPAILYDSFVDVEPISISPAYISGGASREKARYSARDKLFGFNIPAGLKLCHSLGLGFTLSYSMTQVDFYRFTSCTPDSYLDGRGL